MQNYLYNIVSSPDPASGGKTICIYCVKDCVYCVSLYFNKTIRHEYFPWDVLYNWLFIMTFLIVIKHILLGKSTLDVSLMECPSSVVLPGTKWLLIISVLTDIICLRWECHQLLLNNFCCVHVITNYRNGERFAVSALWSFSRKYFRGAVATSVHYFRIAKNSRENFRGKLKNRECLA